MSKLQCIKRVNGSLVYSCNIPIDIIQSLNWGKGLVLELKKVEYQGKKVVILIPMEKNE